MSAEESGPRPWRMEEYGGDQPCCLVDADGNTVCVQYGSADAALIVDAVNNAGSWRSGYIKARTERNAFLIERDRLRDIVRRLVGYCEAVTVYRPPVLEVRGSDGTHEDYNGAELLREARAAIGGEKQ